MRAISSADFGIRAGRKINVGWCPYATIENARDRRAHRLDTERFRYEPGSAKFHAAPDGCGIVIGRNYDDRHARILRAHVHQTGEAASPGHREIEQHQIDVTATFKKLNKFVECPRFRDVDLLKQSLDSLA